MSRFNRFGRDIVSARTPIELAQAATVPVIRDDALVFPTSVPPPPALTPSGPAVFGPYTIRPEIIGAPVQKSVPGMFDEQTLVSLFPSLTAATRVDSFTKVPVGAQTLAPPSPVIDIFNMRATDKADSAIEMDHAAALHSDIADELQQKADDAAHRAAEAAATATVDPNFYAQAEAAAAVARAEDAQYVANRAYEKASVISQKADEKSAEASIAKDQLDAAAAREQEQYDYSVLKADAEAIDSAQAIPGFQWGPTELYQPVDVPGFSVSPAMAAGALGVVGYLLGGARGGAIGALLGGGGAYFMARRG